MFRDLYTTTLRDQFGVDVRPTDTDETVSAALTVAYGAAPSDYVIDGRGLAEARRVAGQNAANLLLAQSRA